MLTVHLKSPDENLKTGQRTFKSKLFLLPHFTVRDKYLGYLFSSYRYFSPNNSTNLQN